MDHDCSEEESQAEADQVSDPDEEEAEAPAPVTNAAGLGSGLFASKPVSSSSAPMFGQPSSNPTSMFGGSKP